MLGNLKENPKLHLSAPLVSSSRACPAISVNFIAYFGGVWQARRMHFDVGHKEVINKCRVGRFAVSPFIGFAFFFGVSGNRIPTHIYWQEITHLPRILTA